MIIVGTWTIQYREASMVRMLFLRGGTCIGIYRYTEEAHGILLLIVPRLLDTVFIYIYIYTHIYIYIYFRFKVYTCYVRT